MPIMTVYIADRGAPLAGGGTSATGHMWFSIDNGAGPESYGFAPIAHGNPYTQGRVYTDDTSNYQNTIYRHSLYISNYQYNILKNFGDNPSSMGFSLWYNGLTNSCIDFTHKALSLISENGAGYEGAAWPSWNINAKLRQILNEIEIRNAVDDLPISTGSIDDVSQSAFKTGCFIQGTPISTVSGVNSIERISPGDRVSSFNLHDDSGISSIEFKKVSKVFKNITRQLIDLRGLICTPGHVFIEIDAVTPNVVLLNKISKILMKDSCIMSEDGKIIRARTGAIHGSRNDTLIKVAYESKECRINKGKIHIALVRAGIPVPLGIVDSAAEKLNTLAEYTSNNGIFILPDGSVQNNTGAHHDACDWPQQSTPFDTPEMQNWVVEVDGQPYTPPWILALVDTDDAEGLQFIGADGQMATVSALPPQRAL